MDTADKGLIFKPNQHSFDVYADADFAGLWDKDSAMDDPSTAKSRTGFLVMYAGCPITWTSKLQTVTTLSSTESEYVSLSTALRYTLPLMTFVTELKEARMLPMDTTPTVHCKAFEDNSGCLEMAKVPKMRPRTKHINSSYHHFRQAVFDKIVSVHAVRTEDQLADILTKNLAENLFFKFRQEICGW